MTFLSNNNILYTIIFLAAFLNFVWLFFAYVFLAAIVKCNFRLCNSDLKFQVSEVHTEICTFKMIYICLSNENTFRDQ